ncbi:MAG: hypothetical protein JWO57_32, partial [Pseudonocardiales bacterium]|nr:hypothetical protein [Pseudonocardiales bacterium]
SDGSCGFAAAAGSVSGSLTITGSLAPLADNGGPTPTMALLPGSPAIGLVTGALGGGLPAVCGTPDQRGVLRPAAACDAGAFQTQQVTPAAPTFTDNVCAATGPAGASYTIPSMTGVDYLVNGGPTPATAGTHPAPDGSTLTITAQPQAGYVLTGATSWTHIYPATPSCPQTITFTTTPPTNAVVGGTYTVAATGGGSGQAVIFSSGSPAICTVTGTTVHFIAAGACVVNANQAGDANYNPASQIAQTITIAAVPTPPSSTPPTQPTPQPSGSGLADTGTLTIELTLLAVLLVAGGGLVLLLGRRPRYGRVHRPRNAPWSRPD